MRGRGAGAWASLATRHPGAHSPCKSAVATNAAGKRGWSVCVVFNSHVRYVERIVLVKCTKKTPWDCKHSAASKVQALRRRASGALATEAWLQRLGHRGLATEAWPQRLGHRGLAAEGPGPGQSGRNTQLGACVSRYERNGACTAQREESAAEGAPAAGWGRPACAACGRCAPQGPNRLAAEQRRPAHRDWESMTGRAGRNQQEVDSECVALLLARSGRSGVAA